MLIGGVAWRLANDYGVAEDGAIYYHNSTTGQTTWEKPPAYIASAPVPTAPPAAQTAATPPAASSDVPKGAGAQEAGRAVGATACGDTGWSEAKLADGATYYFKPSGQTTWEMPAEVAALRGASAAASNPLNALAPHTPLTGAASHSANATQQQALAAPSAAQGTLPMGQQGTYLMGAPAPGPPGPPMPAPIAPPSSPHATLSMGAAGHSAAGPFMGPPGHGALSMGNPAHAAPAMGGPGAASMGPPAHAAAHAAASMGPPAHGASAMGGHLPPMGQHLPPMGPPGHAPPVSLSPSLSLAQNLKNTPNLSKCTHADCGGGTGRQV